MAGDDERLTDRPIDLEDPQDRAFGRAVSGRIQYASVEQLNRVLELSRDTNAKIDALTTSVTEHRKETLEMRGWLLGTTSPDGVPTPGILAQVRSLISLKSMVVVFLTIIATSATTTAVAAVTNAVININAHATLVNAVHP